MDSQSATPLERAREDALLVLSRVLLWGVGMTALPGIVMRIIDGAMRGEVVRSVMMLPPLIGVLAISVAIRAHWQLSLARRGWIAIAGLSSVLGWSFLFNGPRLPNAVGTVALVSLAVLLFDARRQWLLLIGSLLLMIALGLVLRTAGILQPAIDPVLFPLAFAIVETILMIACLGFSAYVLHTTLRNYEAGQIELARRTQELLEAQQRTQALQQRENFAALATGMATELAEVVTVLGAASDEFRQHIVNERGRELLQDLQSVGTRVSQVLRLLASLDPAVPRQPLALGDTLVRLREQLPPLLPASVTLEILDLSAKPRAVPCDRVEQVMWYLVLQARDAMPDGGTLTIRAYDGLGDMARTGEQRNWVIIDVADTGAPEARRGLPQRLIGEPRSAAKLTTKAFGLAVVEQVVSGCGGRIDMEHEAGQPVHFVLQLPVAAV